MKNPLKKVADQKLVTLEEGKGGREKKGGKRRRAVSVRDPYESEESPCSLVFHEVGALFKKLSGLPKNRPTHCTRGQTFLPVPHLIPSQQSSANTEPNKNHTKNRHENSH